MSLFTMPRITTPPRNGDKTCRIFKWIGQSFEYCNRCGQPERVHLYHPPYGRQRPLFYVKQWVEWRKAWVWTPVGSIILDKRREH